MNTRIVLFLTAVAALALPACGATDDLAERAVDEASGGEVKIDKNGRKVKVEVGGHKLENVQGELVGGFPKDVPLPPGYDVQTSTKLEGSTYQAFGTIENQDAAFTFFKQNLSKREWKTQVARTGDGTFQVLAKRGDRKLVVNSTQGTGRANMTVVVDG